jgi:predicted branched-subunit amino acid permease
MTLGMTSPFNPKYPTVKSAFWGGVREAAGVPMLIMGGSFLGFGSMIKDIHWSVWHALYSTLTTWALPGQIAMAELAHSGAPMVAIVLAVALINARLFPMSATLLPHVRRPGIPGWVYYAVAMIIAATSWIGTLRRLPELLPDQKLPFLLGFGLLLYCGSPLFTVAGYLLAGQVPLPITLTLVFVNPLYFTLLFLKDLKDPGRFMALVFGALLGPMLFLLTPDWALVITGLVGGTLAWFIDQRIKNNRGL